MAQLLGNATGNGTTRLFGLDNTWGILGVLCVCKRRQRDLTVEDDSAPQTRFYQEVSSWTDSEIILPSAFLGMLDASAPIYAFIIPEGGTSDSVINYGQVN